MSPRQPVGTTATGSFERQVILSETPVLVDFWAPWCPPCTLLRPRLERVAAELGTAARVLALNVDESPEIADIYGVRSIPSLLLFVDGEPIESWAGLRSADAIVALVRDALGQPSQRHAPPSGARQRDRQRRG
jgi:thioredoxin 1